MRQLSEVAAELDATGIIVELTSAFQGIASMRISQIKNQVQSSEAFFAELWQIYSQIRVDELFHFGRSQSQTQVINKELLLLITSEGSFSGDIDQRLVSAAVQNYKPERNDIIVIGHHGVVQLGQQNIPIVKSFKLPTQDRNINVEPLVAEVQKYASTTVYYQGYISLMDQDVRHMQLSSAVAERGKIVAKSDEVITEQNYIFEPSTFEVIDHLERSMMQITISEVILESKLAQYASRFRAMSTAQTKADETYTDLKTAYSRAKRHHKDERLKEVINGLRKVER